MVGRNRLLFMSIACAASLGTSLASAQGPSFVGTWRSEVTTVGAGGYTVIIDMEDVFQPGGKFSTLTSSKYGNGPAAGGQIGAVQSTGTYKIDAGQSIISFHSEKTSMTQKVFVPTDENDRYQFASPTQFSLQSLAGGPTATFQKVQ
jgi:hypothetical protein